MSDRHPKKVNLIKAKGHFTKQIACFKLPVNFKGLKKIYFANFLNVWNFVTSGLLLFFATTPDVFV